MTWVAAADYRRAKDERQRIYPCQDYGMVQHLDDKIMIGAVASGDEEASLSHVGARLAVRTSLDYLRQAPERAGDATSDATGERARDLYLGMIDAIQDRLREDAVDRVTPVREFAATLSVFVAKPTGVAAMRIGDGLIVSRGHHGDYSLLFSDDDASTRASVTDRDSAERLGIRVQDGPIDFLCAASDPLDGLPTRGQDGTPQKRFFRPLDQYTSVAPDDVEVHRGIRNFLRSDRVNDRLDQDVALALCGYRRQGDLFAAASF